MSKEQLQPIDQQIKDVSESRHANMLWQAAKRFPFYVPLLLVAAITGACNVQGGSESPTPTIDPAVFEPHNVPYVNIVLVDENDDDVFNLFDARRQKGIDWLPGLDRDGQRGEDGRFRITQHDIDVMREFLCLLPASPQDDINGDGHTTDGDLAIVNGYLNKEVEDEKDPNARLDEFWGGIVIDGNESDPTTRDHKAVFEPIQTDPFCK